MWSAALVEQASSLRQRWSPRAWRNFVLSLGVVAIGWQLCATASALLQLAGSDQRPSAAADRRAAQNVYRSPEVLAEHIRAARLFGGADPASQPTARPARAWALAGIVALADPARGYAILRGDSAGQLFVSAGTSLPDGAVVREVYADQVLIDRGGVTERLALPRGALAAGAPLASLQGPRLASSARPAYVYPPVNDPPQGYFKTLFNSQPGDDPPE